MKPRGLKTQATARPSGTLWMARLPETKRPSFLAPEKLTPMPTPSENECMNITKTTRTIFFDDTVSVDFRASQG